MLIKIPYYKQQTEYTCGPASVRMILASFGIKKSESQIAQKVLVTKKFGTSRKNIQKLLSFFGIRFTVYSHASLSLADRALQKGNTLIINYFDLPPDPEDHYAVIVGITSSHIILHDPYWGRYFEIKRTVFLKRWRNQKLKKKYTGWMIEIQGKK